MLRKATSVLSNATRLNESQAFVAIGKGTNDVPTCREMSELVTDYLEGALEEAAAAEFDAHLAQCPGCDEYVRQMRQTTDQLGRVSLDGLSETARARLLAAFGDMFG